VTLFQTLIARIPKELKQDAKTYALLKFLGGSIDAMPEETAQKLAQHIKGFAAYIYNEEVKAGKILESNNNQNNSASANG